MPADEPRVQLYAPEFAADPHRVYSEMRSKHQSLVPVALAPGVPATLVIAYDTALRILNDPEHFPADPRAWQRDIPADCPVLPMMQWRPTGSRSAGSDLLRYRQAITECLAQVNLHAIDAAVERTAIPLINAFCVSGSADLLSQYAFPVAFEMLNILLGCPPEIGERVAAGMAALFDTVDAAAGNAMISDALFELVQLKRTEPGNDITSLLLKHPSRLDDAELVNQLLTHYGAGLECQQNLIANTLLLIIGDDRFGGSVLGGSISTREALDEVLYNDPPLANLLITYPRQPVLIDNVWLPAHQPVVISMAACNNDPAIRAEDNRGNRAHLAWGIGPHACPAQTLGTLIAQNAIDQLLDAIPELHLDHTGGELRWRPGPFHRSLTALPVTFTPTSPLPLP